MTFRIQLLLMELVKLDLQYKNVGDEVDYLLYVLMSPFNSTLDVP